MGKRYIVALSEKEQQYLKHFTTTGKRSARQMNQTRILLKANVNQTNGGYCDREIHEAIGAAYARLNGCVNASWKKALTLTSSNALGQVAIEKCRENTKLI